MKIKVTDVEEKGSISLKYEEDPSILEDSEVSCNDKIRVKVALSKTKDGIYVAGKVDATLNLVCSRCLEPVTYDVESNFGLEYRLRPPDLPEELELDGKSVGIVFYDGIEIDVSDEVRQSVLLSVPMKPLCSESCKGLCKQCGQNLNKGECNCSPIDTYHPFAKLKELIAD